MDNEKNNKQDEQIVEIEFHDVIRVASGVDDEGHPNCAASLAIYTIDNYGETVTKDQEVDFGNAVTSVFSSGGCIVVQVDFPGTLKFEARRAAQIATDWMINLNSPEYGNKFLSLVIMPLKLFGQIYLNLSELVYFTTFHISQHEIRLVMCFDNTSTQVYETDGIDLDLIKAQVEQELDEQMKELEDEAYDLQQQIKKLQEYNPFEEEIRKKYGTVDGMPNGEDNALNESFHRPGYQFNHEEEENDHDEDDEENS